MDTTSRTGQVKGAVSTENTPKAQYGEQAQVVFGRAAYQYISFLSHKNNFVEQDTG